MTEVNDQEELSIPKGSATSQAKTSAGFTLLFKGGGIVLFCGAIYMAAASVYGMFNGHSWGFCIPVLIGSFFAGRFGWRYATVKYALAPCPKCGDECLVADVGQVLDCDGCGSFYSGDNHKIWLVEESYVASDCLFETPVNGASVLWPEGVCCTCGSPATRTIELSVQGKDDSSFQVPHCDGCEAGVEVEEGDSEGFFNMVFRSYPYQRAFASLNAEKG